MISGEGKRFNRLMVRRLRIEYGLGSRYSRLRARGLLTVNEIASYLGVTPATIGNWRRAGLLRAHRYDDKDQYLFEPLGPDTPIKYRHQGKTRCQGKNRGKSASSQASANSIN